MTDKRSAARTGAPLISDLHMNDNLYSKHSGANLAKELLFAARTWFSGEDRSWPADTCADGPRKEADDAD